MDSKLSITHITEKGRPLVILSEPNSESQVQELSAQLADRFAKTPKLSQRLITVTVPRVTGDNWMELTTSLLSQLQEEGLRQAAFVAYGGAGTIAQNLILLAPKFVRSLVLIDSSTRAHPSVFTKIVDRIERILPLGLPLRSFSKEFDGKPFLQRLRCPILLVLTSEGSRYTEEQGNLMSHSLPTAYLLHLFELSKEKGVSEQELLTDSILSFQSIPAKCPQKAKRVTHAESQHLEREVTAC